MPWCGVSRAEGAATVEVSDRHQRAAGGTLQNFSSDTAVPVLVEALLV